MGSGVSSSSRAKQDISEPKTTSVAPTVQNQSKADENVADFHHVEQQPNVIENREAEVEEENEDEINSVIYSPRSPRMDAANADMFQATAMSLGLENDDLLFNLLYFGGGENLQLGQMVNSAMEETVALYSENNTPYKLKPASADVLDSLQSSILTEVSILELKETDCAVCKDDLEPGCEVTHLPACHHCFHRECIMRWFKMV